MIVEGNRKDDWVTPNIPIEVPSFLYVNAGKFHPCHIDKGVGNMTEKSGHGLDTMG